MPTERITFPGSAGASLAGRLELPVDGKPEAYALVAHCFTCSKDLKAVVRLSRALARERFGVLRFDFTGIGESEGDFADTDFSSNVDDLVAAAEWMADELEAPSLLVGHSLGGAAVLHAAHRIPSVGAVSTIGAPAHPRHMLKHIEASPGEIEEAEEARVEIGGRTFVIRKELLEDLQEARMTEAVEQLDRALLIFHSPVDEIVGIDNATQLYSMARHPKSFVSLDGADHLLTDETDAVFVGRMLATWGARYIDLSEPEQVPEELLDEDRVVTRTGESGYRTEIMARGHPLVADEPESVGGTDEGPTPYDLLLAALGACTSMTLRMYADRKEWPLEEVTVRQKHRKIHQKDCETDCDGGDEALDQVSREIEMRGPLDEEQRKRLLEIADRCPVHRTLDRGVKVETMEKGGPPG
ncbi:MAG: alpha/beta fold hydrolase [Longimicrobiales bacterium]